MSGKTATGRLRTGGAVDAQDLAALHRRSFDSPWPVTVIADLLVGIGMIALIWEEADVAQGFILTRVVADEAEILTLAVDGARRGAGLGAILLERAVDMAGEQGADAVFLEVAVDNVAALALYARAGFTKVGKRRAYYTNAAGQSIDALVLRRNLNKPKV